LERSGVGLKSRNGARSGARNPKDFLIARLLGELGLDKEDCWSSDSEICFIVGSAEKWVKRKNTSIGKNQYETYKENAKQHGAVFRRVRVILVPIFKKKAL